MEDMCAGIEPPKDLSYFATIKDDMLICDMRQEKISACTCIIGG